MRFWLRKMQQCCKLHLGVKQWPYIVESQYKHLNTCLYNMVIVTALGVPTCQEGIEGSNQLESIAPLKVPFAGCSVLMLFCWHYSHRHSPSHRSGWLRKTFHSCLIHSANIMGWFAQLTQSNELPNSCSCSGRPKATLQSLLCSVQLSVQQLWSAALYIFPCASWVHYWPCLSPQDPVPLLVDWSHSMK